MGSGIVVARVGVSPLFITQLIDALNTNWGTIRREGSTPERSTTMATTLKIQTLKQSTLSMDSKRGTVVQPAGDDARKVVAAMLRRTMKQA